MSDLIIEGAKRLSDGLYVIKDNELFKYKPNRSTVYTARSYHITDRPRGEWVWNNDSGDYFCSVCGKVHYYNIDEIISGAWKFCPSCGAYMKGGEDK